MERYAVPVAPALVLLVVAIATRPGPHAQARVTIYNSGTTSIVLDRIRVGTSERDFDLRLDPGDGVAVVLDNTFVPPCSFTSYLCDFAPAVEARWHDTEEHACISGREWIKCAVHWGIGTEDPRGFAGNIDAEVVLHDRDFDPAGSIDAD